MDSIDKSLIICPSVTLLQALKQMDRVHRKMLLVIEDNRFLSILTIGDIQRAIIKKIDVNCPIVDILDSSTKQYCTTTDSDEDIKNAILAIRAEMMPVLDSDGHLAKIYYWTDFFSGESSLSSRE